MKKIVLTCAVALLIFTVAYGDDISLTIYTDNFGLVKQTQTLDFKKGTGETRFDNVAALIDPTSVHISPKDKGISILEQNFQYDLVNTQKMMQKYLGSDIGLLTKGGDAHKGTLLSFDGKYIILKSDSGEITVTNADEVVDYRFGKLPEGLILKPSLVWLAESDREKSAECEVSYLTDGLNWHAEYVAVVDKDDKNIDLSGWVSIDNKSGATFEDASLKLVAGKVNRVSPQPQPSPLFERDIVSYKSVMAPQFQEETFFEYHLYTLERKATVADNEIKQLTLFPEAKTEANKVYTLENSTDYYGGNQQKPKVKVNLEFTNSEQHGLGMPLPKGKLRVYKADSKGDLQFIGEDEIDHTPKDEKVRVFLGEAFDVAAERKQTNLVDLGNDHARVSYQVDLRNHKDSDIVVTVIESTPGWREWHIIDSNIEYKKVSAYKVEFQVPVKLNGANSLTYTIEY